MARALASVLNILYPEVVVLGGGLSNITRLYDNVPRLWQRYVFSDGVEDPPRAPGSRRFQRRTGRRTALG